MKKLNQYSATIDIDTPAFSDIIKFVDGEIVDVTETKLNEICYKRKNITLVSKYSGVSKTFKNKNGFTVGEMFNNIAVFEHEVRALTDWYDTHHIFFEGLREVPGKKNTYTISWGS